MKWQPGMWMFVKSSAKLPSLKILAVKVCLAIEREIKLLMTLLKCFPHLETLHIKVVVVLVHAVSTCKLTSTAFFY